MVGHCRQFNVKGIKSEMKRMETRSMNRQRSSYREARAMG